MGNLYVVSVPIGNTKDITYNAVETLSNADIIACEDTRVSGLLLKEYNIKSKLVSYHKFNENNKSDFLIDELKNGKNIAIISDAGTPCINDPGTYIIKKAIDNNINVIANPGASAVITALSISGFDITTFTYLGFIPRVGKEIDEVLDSIKESNYELFVFYESPKRIKKSLEIISDKLNNPDVCVFNDLTKIHQRIYRGNSLSVLNELNENPNSEKGEYVLIIKYVNTKRKGNIDISNEALLVNTIKENNCSMKEAINICRDLYKINKNELYEASLNLKKLI